MASSAYAVLRDEQVARLAIPDKPHVLSPIELAKRHLVLVDVRVAVDEYFQTLGLPGDYCPSCGGSYLLGNWRPGEPPNSYPAPRRQVTQNDAG